MKAMTLNNFINYHYLSNIQANPSHTMAGFVVKKANLANNNYDSTIHLTDGKRVRQLTALNKESSYIWLNDEDILFHASRQQENKDEAMSSFYRINIHGGEAQFAFTLPFTVTSLDLVDENTLLVKATIDLNHPNFYKLSEEKRKVILKEAKEQAYQTIIDEIPFWRNGGSYTNKERNRLFLYDIKTKNIQPLTPPAFDCWNYYLDKDQQIIYLSGETYRTKVKLKEEFYTYEIKTKKLERRLRRQFYDYRGFYKVAGQLIVEASDGKNIGHNQNSRFYRYDQANDRLEVISDELLIGNSLGSDIRLGGSSKVLASDDQLIYNCTINDHSELYRLNKELKIEPYYQSKGSIDGFTIVNDKLITIELTKTPQELYLVNDHKPKRLSNFNQEAIKDYYLAPIKTFKFKSNQANLTGYVLLPYDYDKTKKYPAILDIHGGPKTAYGPIYYHEMQYWASIGYFVFFTNPHGSSGVSDAFSDIRGKYGSIDYEDLMTLVDEVLKRYPAIDENRLGVTGGSYGGFMTNWIITHTQRFKAAATQRSISNWLSFYGVSDIGYFFAGDQNQGSLDSEKDQQKLWQHSPLKYIKNAQTPTLIIHSEKDYRCPIDQAYQLYTSLINQNVDSRMVIYHEENHDLSRSGKPKARLSRLKEISDWMDKYLKKDLD